MALNMVTDAFQIQSKRPSGAFGGVYSRVTSVVGGILSRDIQTFATMVYGQNQVKSS